MRVKWADSGQTVATSIAMMVDGVNHCFVGGIHNAEGKCDDEGMPWHVRGGWAEEDPVQWKWPNPECQ
jgi:hypothetical protein